MLLGTAVGVGVGRGWFKVSFVPHENTHILFIHEKNREMIHSQICILRRSLKYFCDDLTIWLIDTCSMILKK